MEGKNDGHDDAKAGAEIEPPSRAFSLAAEQALKEAEERRKPLPSEENAPKEVGGRKGPEPTRYGDWEKKGIVSDF